MGEVVDQLKGIPITFLTSEIVAPAPNDLGCNAVYSHNTL